MKKIVVKGPALSQSGYGEHTRFILRALRSKPEIFDIYLININWGQTGWLWEDTEERRWIDFLLNKTIHFGQQQGTFDLSLQVTIPNEWERLAPINIGATAGIETTKIAPVWVEKSMQMDKIIVTTQHAKYGFDNTEYKAVNNATGENFMAKTTCPIEVVSYPVKNIDPEPIEIDFKYDFNFLTIATWIPRKNLENTIKWFVEECYDHEAGLIVKTSIAKNCLQDRRIAEDRLKQLLIEYEGRTCEVYLLHGDMTEGEMTSLYTHPKVKSLISLSHGEGFGLPLFEASYNELPIIACGWSGPSDFLYMPVKNKKGKINQKPMFSSVSYDLKVVQPEAVWDGVIQADSQWCYSREWDYKRCIRQTIKDYNNVKAKARKLKKHVEKIFAQDKMYGAMCDAIYEQSEEDSKWDQKLNEIQAV